MEYNEKVQLIYDQLIEENYPESYSSEEKYTLAITIVEIGESIDQIKKDMKIIYEKNNSREKLDDLFIDLGDELRHILYHIKDSKYYNYLES